MDYFEPILTRFSNFLRRFNLRNSTTISVDDVQVSDDELLLGVFFPVGSLAQLQEFESAALKLFNVDSQPRVIHHQDDGLLIEYILL